MTELKHNDLDSQVGLPGHPRLGTGQKLPPGLKQSEAIRKAGQLRIVAHVKNWLVAEEPAA
jgi:hypothetical protein